MTTWTKELPKESGFYWYRDPEPQVVEFDAGDGWIYVTGRDFPSGPPFMHKIAGEFWPERILAPDERFNLKITPKMREHMASLFTHGSVLYVPGKPTSFQVELDPNHPQA